MEDDRRSGALGQRALPLQCPTIGHSYIRKLADMIVFFFWLWEWSGGMLEYVCALAEKASSPDSLVGARGDWGGGLKPDFSEISKGNKGWASSTYQFLPKNVEHPPFIRGYIPAFSSIQRRAEPDYQRNQKLKAEDELLRRILLPEDERSEIEEFPWIDGEDGTISIL